MAKNFFRMKKLFLFALCMMAWVTCNAQEYFEGTLKARSFENYGGDYERASGGMMINGVRDVEYHIKGSKIAIIDHTSGINTIYDAGAEQAVFFVFTNINKVIRMPFSYVNQIKIGKEVEPTPTDVRKTVGGKECRLYTVDTEVKEKGRKTHFKIDAYVCDELPINPVLQAYNNFNNGACNGVPGVAMKYVVQQNISSLAFATNFHVAYEVHEVIPCQVDDSIFEIPAGAQIVDGTKPMKMMAVYNENYKIILKNREGQEAADPAIKFDVDEEWDF